MTVADLLFHATFKNNASVGLKQLTADLGAARMAAAGTVAPTKAMSDNINRLERGVSRSYNEISRFSKEVSRAGDRMTMFVSAPLAFFFYKSAQAASDMVEQLNKTNVAFGNSSNVIHKHAKSAANDLLMSTRAYETYAGTFGAFLSPLNTTDAKKADLVTTMISTGADLASFYNTTIDQALSAMQSGLVGQQRPLRKFGINLSEEQVNAEAKRNGSWDGSGNPSEPAKILSRYNLEIAQASLAHGDVARTAGTASNQQKKLTAEFDNTKLAIGQEILPAYNALLHSMNFILGVFNAMPGSVHVAVIAFGGLILVLGPILSILGRIAALNAAIAGGKLGSGLMGVSAKLGFSKGIAAAAAKAGGGAAIEAGADIAGAGAAAGAGGVGSIGALGILGPAAVVAAVTVGAGLYLNHRTRQNQKKEAGKWATNMSQGMNTSTVDNIAASKVRIRALQDEQKDITNQSVNSLKQGVSAQQASDRYNALGETLVALNAQQAEMIKQQGELNDAMGYSPAIRARIDAYDALKEKVQGVNNAMQGFNRTLDLGQAQEDLVWSKKEFAANQAKYGPNWVGTFAGHAAQRDLAKAQLSVNQLAMGPNDTIMSQAALLSGQLGSSLTTLGVNVDTSPVLAAIKELQGLEIGVTLVPQTQEDTLHPLGTGFVGEAMGMNLLIRSFKRTVERATVMSPNGGGGGSF